MRKAIAVLAVVGLLVGALMIVPAEAGKKKKKKKPPPAPERIERVVEFDYTCPCGIRGGVGWQLGEATGENIGGGPIPIGADDVWVTAKVEDQAGQKVHISLSHDTDGDGLNNTWATFCGETTEPIEVSQAEAVVRVFVYAGTCEDNSPSFPTQGTVTFTFSNLPPEAAPAE
jgi:hypothetical protein